MTRGRLAASSFLLIVALLASTACSGPDRSEIVPDESSAQRVVQTYVELRAKGNDRSAEALVWRPERFGEGPPGDFFLGATDILVGTEWNDPSTARRKEYEGGLTEISELTVELTTHKYDSVGQPPGEYVIFVTLGREEPGGPWWILETGTGP